MSDLINIKDERFWDILFHEACVEGEQAGRIEKELEQITVEPARGEWIRQNDTYTKFMCSNCGSFNHPLTYDFCPNCGADMRKKVTE